MISLKRLKNVCFSYRKNDTNTSLLVGFVIFVLKSSKALALKIDPYCSSLQNSRCSSLEMCIGQVIDGRNGILYVRFLWPNMHLMKCLNVRTEKVIHKLALGALPSEFQLSSAFLHWHASWCCLWWQGLYWAQHAL